MSSKPYPTLQTELALFQAGNRFVIGVDEVGRGAIAGPVAVGIALIDSQSEKLESWPSELRDSKLMTAISRAKIFEELANWSEAYAIGYSSNLEIDNLGINPSLQLAAGRAFEELLKNNALAKDLVEQGCQVLLDGSHNWLGSAARGLDVVTQVKADADCVSVAAASVLAKVSRDRQMEQLATEYPDYGLESHKGYASNGHIQAIHSLGPSVIHRHSWLTRILG